MCTYKRNAVETPLSVFTIISGPGDFCSQSEYYLLGLWRYQHPVRATVPEEEAV
jgi:hypothetical protein